MAFQDQVDHVGDWPGYLRAIQSLEGRWVFRGGLEDWSPETTLERACRVWNVPLSSAVDAERRLVSEFRRHPEARQALEGDDYLSCLALMQHYGAPTRLLDWTYSPYVAAFFAFQSLVVQRDPDQARASVWALNLDWLDRALEHALGPSDWQALHRADGDRFTEVFVDREPAQQFIAVAVPAVLHHRLSIQQGLFLCPGDVTVPWIDNLRAVGWSAQWNTSRSFVFASASMDDAFDELHRMNVTSRSLFPGIDGFAKSMLQRFKQVLEGAP